MFVQDGLCMAENCNGWSVTSQRINHESLDQLTASVAGLRHPGLTATYAL